MTADQATVTPSSRWPFRIGLAVGLPILALGVRGALVNSADTRPAELARWLVGSAVLHDGIVVPLVTTVAWVIHRVAPAWSWPAIRFALFATAVLVLVSRPFVARYGATPANPTALDRPYGSGVLIALAVIWVVAGAWLLIDGRTHRRGRASPAAPRGNARPSPETGSRA